MPYKVKATLVRFLGDTEKYPCHMNYQVGDEIIFDGEKFSGRICPEILPQLGAKIQALHSAGPRYVDPGYYNLFWYASASAADAQKKKYDGNGFRPVLKTIEEPPHTLAELIDPNAFQWPPIEKRVCLTDVMLICPDARTSAVFKLEAVDLCEFGDAAPYFRREMTIISKLQKNPGMTVEEIRNSYSEEQIYEIYPPLTSQMVGYMLEEMLSVQYVEERGGRYFVTAAAVTRLEQFISEITDEEIEALEL